MKRSFKLLFVVSVLLFVFDIQLFAQDPIDQYPGIPLVIYPARRTIDMIPQNFTQMSEMGIYGVVAPDILHIDSAQYLQHYKDYNLKLIPQQIWWAPNDIYKYTDAYYTVWEAEGTDPTKGLATLYHNSNMSVLAEGDTISVWTNNNTIPAGTELIFGPGYPQVAEYKSTVFDTVINYTAEFKMKIVPKTTPPSGNPVVCTLRVTNLNENLVETDIITPIEVRLNDFGGWNNWKSIPVQYDLMNVTLPNIDEALAGQPTAFCVQFKIVWNGLSFLDLYIDNIIISDQNGKAIATISDIQELVAEVAGNYINDSSIIGWYALDEPGSIDNYEPYRIVDSIINSVSNGNVRLHTGFTGGKRGKFSSWLDIDIMALGKFQDQEFWLRAKPKNLQINLYNYHYPYKPWSGPSFNENWKEVNIDYVTNTYLDRINDLDTNFTFSTQTGGYYNYDTLCNFIDTFLVVPSKYQISYHVNLGLLYGAKELRLDPMFSSYCDTITNPKVIGLINLAEDTTANYNFFRYTLIPRLNGSFGKELKKIHQKIQHPKLQLPRTQPINSTYNWLSSITYLNGEGASGADFIDVGFFETHYNSGDVPYFMVVNRWYNTANPGELLKISIDKTGTGYTNWNVTNFIENTNQTIVNSGYVTMPHIPGEARLFKVYPVVKGGGKLAANETVLGGITLTEDITIENGATLYLFGNYNANANITVKNGGKIICSGNGKITFGLGKQLFLEGNAQLLGNSPVDKLKLVFNIYGDGIVIKPSSNVLIDNCEISGAYQGIANQIGDQSAVNILNTKINAVYCGVSLSGGSGSELQSTPTIQNCNITSTISGIAVSNFSEFLIQNNKLNNCGITVSNIPASYIQGNNINGGASQNIVGVFLNNSGGYIRKDTVTNCLNAVQLANSSPDIGGCLIYNNKRHGIYIGSGSIPNLVGYYTTNPPTNFALSGYNKIDANGLQTGSNPVDNDGSEIYLTRANILLSNGCNQISDDRTSIPTMNTQYLISGSLNSGNSINAVYNYWGTKPITSSRFKNLNVTFSPYYNSACSLNGGGGTQMLVLKTSNGTVVDSIASAEGEPESFTALQESYSIADNRFATGNVIQAKPLYEQIITGNYTSEEKLSAYNKLYAIGNLTGEDETYFTSLQTTFEDIASNEADTLIKKVYEQNAIKCDVSKEEYLTAINKFDNIIQQNPNSEEAVYAEIDIITTALNLDTTNSGLGKISSKYLVKGTSDYLSKLNDILQSKFGINSEDEKHIIPKEYSLYQNYPNPFNPTTTIKFDIPDVGTGLSASGGLSNVTLKVYDILGKEVATLINEQISPGSYEHQFDASNLASGVYIYKLQAGDFVSSRKMILLK